MISRVALSFEKDGNGKKKCAVSDFTGWVDSVVIPFGLVIEVNPISSHVSFSLLERELYL